MSERREKLDNVLGKNVVAYYLEDGSEMALLFEDGAILEWWEHYCEPTSPAEQGTTDTVRSRLEGEWVRDEGGEDAVETVGVPRRALETLRSFADTYGNEYGNRDVYRAIESAGRSLGMDDPTPRMPYKEWWVDDE